MTKPSQKPYENLDPSVILTAIESAGFTCSGSLLALNSYENRVYQVGIEDDSPLIAKFYRPNRWTDQPILEEHQFSQELTSHEIPVIAPISSDNKTLHHYQEFRFCGGDRCSFLPCLHYYNRDLCPLLWWSRWYLHPLYPVQYPSKRNYQKLFHCCH